MRTPCFALLAALCACGNDPATTMSATDSGTGSTTTPDPTVTGGPTSSTSTGDEPTVGTNGMTDSGTTTAATTEATTAVTSSTGSTSTTGEETGTTMPVLDTGSSDPGTTASDETTAADSSSSSGEESSTGMMMEACPCPDLEVPIDDGIFVLSITAELWKFFPETNTFQPLGALGCPLPPNTFSMGVDRLGNAWVQYSGGELRTVPVGDPATCSNPGYVVGQMGITNFGMAFVSNSGVDVCDRIYGNRFDNNGFFSIDPMGLNVMPIGQAAYSASEVTGTGDGRAFLFTPGVPAHLVELDKANATTVSDIPLPGVSVGSAYAFAHFAGDFYFFTNSKGGPGSEVTHIDYDDSDMNGKQDITEVVADAPMSIVGAGVSTCAPFAPQ